MPVVGAAQKRALLAMAEAPDGLGEVPFLSAPGLINKRLAVLIGRTGSEPHAPYICQITDAGRAVISHPEGGLRSEIRTFSKPS
jgi:hypothetical protein